jgi:hypothetical protein
MKKFNDLESQLSKKGASVSEHNVGKKLANEMLSHVSGGARAGDFWIKATWRLRF